MRPAGTGGCAARYAEPLLLGGDRGEDHRAPRRLGQRLHGLRDREHRGHARGVVQGAVVDVVLSRLRALLDAEVIVVGGVDDRFLRELRVPARPPPDDVLGLRLLDLVLQGDVGGYAQAHGPEVTLLGGGAESVEVLSAEPRDLARALLGHPGLDRQLGFTLVGQGELLTAPGRLHHLPRIARGMRRVDDDGAGGAHLGGHLVLVGPAPVVEARLAREELRIVLGVVVHHEEDLALEVGSLVVVPLVLGGHDPVAHEHDLAAAGAGLGDLHAGERHVVVAVAQVDRLAATGEMDGGGRIGADAHDVEWLEPAAVGSGRLQAQAFHLRGDVFLGQPIASARGPSPLEEVTGQEADVGADQLGADLPGGRLLGRRHDGGSGHRHRGVDGQREAGGDEAGGEEELHPRRIAQPGFPQEPGRIKPSALFANPADPE